MERSLEAKESSEGDKKKKGEEKLKELYAQREELEKNLIAAKASGGAGVGDAGRDPVKVGRQLVFSKW